jgi:galactonate dehydratase
MKVTGIEIFITQTEKDPSWHPIVIRVNTDEGISGLGEVGLAYGTGYEAGANMVKNLAENFILGSDPMKSEKAWETMFRNSFWALGGGPVVYGGMSAIDIAFWDIKGKALKQPIYQLLGGKTNDKLRAYASQMQYGWGKTMPRIAAARPEEYAEETRKALAAGFDAVKVDPLAVDENGKRNWDNLKIIPPERLKLIYNRVKAMREVAGPDVDIILETHSLLSGTTAIQVGRALYDLNMMYYEETNAPLNPEVMKKVAENVKIPLATGERVYTRWGYRPFIEQQILAVVQPDLCLVGGITEGKKIADFANVYDITLQAHTCGSPITTVAALHLEAVTPNFIIHEHNWQAIKEYNTMICLQDYQPVNGYYSVPELPGLGLDLDEKVVKNFPKIVVK